MNTRLSFFSSGLFFALRFEVFPCSELEIHVDTTISPELIAEKIATTASSKRDHDGLFLFWQDVDVGNGTLFTGGPGDLAQVIGFDNASVFELGCSAAAFHVANENWTMYLQLGRDCWKSPKPICSFAGFSDSVYRFFGYVIDFFSSTISEVWSRAVACAMAEPGTEVTACVPSNWQEAVFSFNELMIAWLGITTNPLTRLMAFVFVLVVSLAIVSFLWAARAAMIWMVLTLIVGILTLLLALYQVCMLFLDIVGFFLVRAYSIVLESVYTMLRCSPDREASSLLKRLQAAQSYDDWRALLERLEDLDNGDSYEASSSNADLPRIQSSPAVHDSESTSSKASLPRSSSWSGSLMSRFNRRGEDEQTDDDLLRENMESLKAAVDERNLDGLLLTLRGQLTRNHAGTNHAAESGMRKLWTPRPLVLEYVSSLEQALAFVADAVESNESPLDERLAFFRERQQTFGRTALCLSGGGSLAMYHMGVCKELILQDLLPNVISGTSGGSIVVAFLAIHTNEELLEQIFVDDISTRHPERWFPPIWQQVLLFAQKGVLVRKEEFARTTRRYYGEITFAEAFARTGRCCSITVSTLGSLNRTGASMLLNHITAPHVTVASAVATSCAAPGILDSSSLMAKIPGRGLEPFDAGGRTFKDGTMRADLPKQRLAELFHCNQFIVSQVNPHIAPFARRTTKSISGTTTTIAKAGFSFLPDSSTSSVCRQLEDWMAIDIRHRVQVLSKFGLMPTLFGWEIGPHLRQSHAEFRRGVTLVPETIGISEVIKAIQNPTVADMRQYLLEGQRSVWVKAEHIRHLLKTERALQNCVDRVVSRTQGADLGEKNRRRTM